MKREWSKGGPLQLGAFPVHPVSHQARLGGQSVAFVRPPPVHSQAEYFQMLVPIASRIIGGLAIGVTARNAAMQVLGWVDNVEDNSEVFRVQLTDDLFRVGEHSAIEGKRPVTCVPTRRTKTRAEVDEGITGQLLITKCPGFVQHFFTAHESAMRLEVAKGPDGRHMGKARQIGEFFHNLTRICGCGQEEIEWN